MSLQIHSGLLWLLEAPGSLVLSPHDPTCPLSSWSNFKYSFKHIVFKDWTPSLIQSMYGLTWGIAVEQACSYCDDWICWLNALLYSRQNTSHHNMASFQFRTSESHHQSGYKTCINLLRLSLSCPFKELHFPPLLSSFVLSLPLTITYIHLKWNSVCLNSCSHLFFYLLGLFRPLYAEDADGFSIHTYDEMIIPLELYLVFWWRQTIIMGLNDANERQNFINALYELTGLGMSCKGERYSHSPRCTHYTDISTLYVWSRIRLYSTNCLWYFECWNGSCWCSYTHQTSNQLFLLKLIILENIVWPSHHVHHQHWHWHRNVIPSNLINVGKKVPIYSANFGPVS